VFVFVFVCVCVCVKRALRACVPVEENNRFRILPRAWCVCVRVCVSHLCVRLEKCRFRIPSCKDEVFEHSYVIVCMRVCVYLLRKTAVFECPRVCVCVCLCVCVCECVCVPVQENSRFRIPPSQIDRLAN